MNCYITVGIYGARCPFTFALNTFVYWAGENQDDFLKAIANSHSDMVLTHDVSTILSWYLNA